MKKILCFALCVSFILSFNVYATTMPTIQSAVTVDGINQIINISGKIIADVLPSKISCMVKDKAIDELTPVNIETAVAHALEIPVNTTTGIFSTTLNMSAVEKSKTYRINLGSSGLDILQTERILDVYLPSVSDTQTALNQMNTATELNIGDLISNYVLPQTSILGIYKIVLYAQNASEVNKRLVAKRALLGGSFINVVAFQTAWSDEMAYQQRRIDLLNTINSANRETLTNILTTNNDILSLNFTDYNLYGNIEINKRLVGITYQNIEAFISAFYVKVAEVKAEALNQSLPSGTGGGGGGNNGFPSSATVTLPVKTPDVITEFRDIENYDWAKESISTLHEKGIVSGDGEGNFMPEKQVTREEFTKMIVLALNIPIVESGDSFLDVEKNAWYEKYIISAKQIGIITGKSDGDFGVGSNITREDMAVISVRATEFMKIALKQVKSITFVDATEISDYASTAVETMSGAGIINGYDNGSFLPKDFATRSQTAKIIYGVMNLKS